MEFKKSIIPIDLHFLIELEALLDFNTSLDFDNHASNEGFQNNQQRK